MHGVESKTISSKSNFCHGEKKSNRFSFIVMIIVEHSLSIVVSFRLNSGSTSQRPPLFENFTNNIFIVNEKELLFNLKRYYQIKPGSMMTWNKEGQKRLFTCKVLNLFKIIYYLIKTHNYLLPEKNPSPLLRNG